MLPTKETIGHSKMPDNKILDLCPPNSLKGLCHLYSEAYHEQTEA